MNVIYVFLVIFILIQIFLKLPYGAMGWSCYDSFYRWEVHRCDLGQEWPSSKQVDNIYQKFITDCLINLFFAENKVLRNER